MWFKHWPTWPDRTGTSTLTATTVDPYDDAHRIANFTSSYIDPDADPTGHAAATIGNNVTQSGNAGKIFPHSLNPLRKYGEQIKFKGVGFRCRRLNNRNVLASNNDEDVESIDGTVNYYNRHVNAAPTLGGSAPLDVNLYNAGYTHFVRVGWNLVLTYGHFYGNANDTFDSWSNLINSFNTSANSDGVYFAGQDGKFRLQSLELDEAFCEHLDPTWGTPSNNPNMEKVRWKQDIIALRFVGTPPPVDKCPIAKIVSFDERARDYATSLTGDAAVRKRDLTASGRLNWLNHQLAGFAAGQNSLTYQLTPGQSKVVSPARVPEGWPSCLIFDGDSGTPHFASTYSGEAFLGYTKLTADFTDAGMHRIGSELQGLSREFFDDYVSFSATTEGAHALDSGGSTGLDFVDPIGDPNTVPSITGPIKPKRSEGVGKVPPANALEAGEIATNLTDGTIYSKKNDGTVVLLGYTPIFSSDVSGLGTAAVEDTGVTANDVVQLDGSARLPAVDGSQLTNLPAATSMPASGLTSGDISINLIPDGDNTREIGATDARWAEIHGNLDGAVHFRARNDAGRTLNVGDIVYISGTTGAETPNVALARASDSARMPAFGMISTGGNDQAEVYVTTLGSVTGVALPSSTYTVGDEVYVSTVPGQFTTTAPTGESNLVQKIGKVTRTHNSDGTMKIMGAGRTNATPNLDQDKVFLGNASNQAASTALSAINLSKFNNDLSLADDDWKYTPKNTVITRVFDDMLGVVGRNSRMNGPFFGMGTSSSFWQDSFGDTPASGETGVARAYLNANAYARCVITGHQIYAANAPVGTEWLYEGRFYFDFNSNAANDPSVAFGAYCPKTEHSDSTTEGGFGYGDTSKAGVYWKKNNTYWKSYAYDVEGTNGGTVETDLTPFTPAEDTWVRVAVHCKRETVFSVDVWTIKVYIDGTLATTQYLNSGTEAPTFYSAIYNSGTAYQNNMYVDWLMFQFTRPDSVSYLDIEDL